MVWGMDMEIRWLKIRNDEGRMFLITVIAVRRFLLRELGAGWYGMAWDGIGMG